MVEASEERHVEVVIRTPAGISRDFRLSEREFVASVVAAAVARFVEHKELASGDYALGLVRDGEVESMLDTARVEDYHLAKGSELHLINAAPQVDG
jgi:hypothetical protein